MEKSVRSLVQENAGKAYQTLKKLGAQPGDCTDESSFTLSSHLDKNLTTEQSMNRILEHFASISQDFEPLNFHSLSDDVKAKLSKIKEADIPVLFENQVWQKIKKAKKPNSVVPGDVPKRIIEEFSPEFASPMCKIYNKISETGHWPKSWRVEYGTPLQKKSNPAVEDDLRIISLTSFF